MLEFFFKKPTRLRQLRRGPLAEHLDGLAGELRLKGYRHLSAQQILSVSGKFSNFIRTLNIDNVEQINQHLVDLFLEELVIEGDFKYAPNALQHLMNYLQRRGTLPQSENVKSSDPDSELLIRFDHHLSNVRGLTDSTRENYLRGGQRFLTWYRDHYSQRKLNDLRGTDILNFITHFLEQPFGDVWKKHLCSQTRIFLRYLRWEGIIQSDLDRQVPCIPHWRLARVPRHLPWEKVQNLIDNIDVDNPEGKRDKAVILLLATLGLRNKEIRMLCLDHIIWRESEIHLPRTKNLKERILPLTLQIGETLADYVLNGRPKVNNPYLFLSHRAPFSHYQSAGGIVSILRKRLKNAGIQAPSNGAHMLRHSLATRMVNVGVPIGEIADLLGHASIDTTAIYTKVDVNHLTSVALPSIWGSAR